MVGTGVAALFGLSAFGQRYYSAGIGWPLDVLRVCAFSTLPACIALLLVAYRAAKTRCVGAARWGRVHLDILGVSSVLMVITLLALQLIGFSPIT